MADTPTIIARGFDDVLLDNLKTKLAAFSTREAAINSAAAFAVEIDECFPYKTEGALVNLYIDDDLTSAKAKSHKAARQGTLTVKAQCWATSGTRLRYLKTQALTGIYSLSTLPSLGYSDSEINYNWPDWHRFDVADAAKAMNKTLYAGEWSFEVEHAFSPEELEFGNLSHVHIDAGLWTGDYTITH